MERVSCNSCSKRASCTRICKELEKQLPQLDDGVGWAELHVMDREVVWSIQDHETSLPVELQDVARLYYRLGLSQVDVAGKLGIPQRTVSRILLRIRAAIGGVWLKTS